MKVVQKKIEIDVAILAEIKAETETLTNIGIKTSYQSKEISQSEAAQTNDFKNFVAQRNKRNCP